RGGLPQYDPNEEVALVYVNHSDRREGIWYLSHLDSEWQAGATDAEVDKRTVDAIHYAIEAELLGERNIQATCRIRIRTVVAGERVIKFGLLPNLRVSAATLNGEPVTFIQEPRKQDGSLYVVMPEPLAEGAEYELGFTYASEGKKVIRSAGSGNFFVLARTSWYPSLNSFRDRATFELSFRYPKKYSLVSVGNRVEEGKDKKVAYSKWSSEIPLAVAGFNLGRF
ncbi:MAG: M1 family metallopeptidase, partial [bacterium]|nr:M1 family metallopeptidase [bacterium]